MVILCGDVIIVVIINSSNSRKDLAFNFFLPFSPFDEVLKNLTLMLKVPIFFARKVMFCDWSNVSVFKTKSDFFSNFVYKQGKDRIFLL